jgi:hypothetical protein
VTFIIQLLHNDFFKPLRSLVVARQSIQPDALSRKRATVVKVVCSAFCRRLISFERQGGRAGGKSLSTAGHCLTITAQKECFGGFRR